MPKIPSDALRQAFIDHGQSMGVGLEPVARETPLTEVAHAQRRVDTVDLSTF